MPPEHGERETGPPDFIGVGAVATGGGWWLRMLLGHPEVRGPQGRRRSLNAFGPFCTRAMTDADVAAYHAHFPRRPGTLTGEWTGRYMCDAWTPPLLRRVAPDAKLLVMLADPIERYRSIYADRRAARPENEVFFMTDVADRRHYAAQLARLQRFFDPAQILVLQYERCRADPAAEYRRTLAFLGVRDTTFAPRRLKPAAEGRREAMLRRLRLPERLQRRLLERITARPATSDAAPLWPALESALHTALDDDVARLARMVPELDLALWPDFAQLAAGARAPAASA